MYLLDIIDITILYDKMLYKFMVTNKIIFRRNLIVANTLIAEKSNFDILFDELDILNIF